MIVTNLGDVPRIATGFATREIDYGVVIDKV